MIASVPHLSSRPQSLWQRIHLDPVLLSGLVMLAGIGLLVLYSAADGNMVMVYKQGIRLGIAFGIMGLIAQIHPRTFYRWAPYFYAGGIILLIAVLVLGDIGKGAQRWLDLGIIRFQPSEFVKIFTPMLVARFLSQNPLPPQMKTIALAGGWILLPTLLIAKQPDLGTALLVASAGFAVLFFAGIPWRLLGILAAAGLAAMPALWFLLHDYQRDRLLMFLNPEQDPLGRGYHTIQAKIAIGSGGLWGKGWLEGTQSHLAFLPEPHTDFIFAVWAEEFGLLGCIAMLILYLAIIARGFFMALQAQDSFSRLFGAGLSLTFFVYVFVNIGMVIGILPVVGVPLPLVSYGGTSMVTVMAGFGIMMSLYTHRRLVPS